MDEPPPGSDIPSPFDDWDYHEAETEQSLTPPATAAVRRESLQQRTNFASTGEFILHSGPKVRVVGRTLLIHDKGKPHGVSLQLARQVHKKGFIPAWTVEPARIYIDGPETEHLYARLSEARQNVAELAETEYLIVKTGSDPNIAGLEALLRMVAESPEQFVPLTNMVAADQLDALRAVVNVGRFRLARQELASLVAASPPESKFQRWFEDNDWVFGSEYVGRLDKSRHIAPDSIIDLVFLAVDDFADIFELKRPSADVFVQPPGRKFFIPSGDLNAAFGQAVHYLAEADGMSFFNQVSRELPVYRPRVRLVIGRSNDWTDAQYRAYRDTSVAWNRVELLTYDMVLRRIDLLIRTMLRELKAKASSQA